jgi:L-asparaginase II
MENPVMVEATRGNFSESYHRGIAAVTDSLGHVIRSWGNIQHPIFARSALKVIQILPLIETGAADAFHLLPQHIALACSSHHGERMHMDVANGWLHRIEKSEEILECGIYTPPHGPYHTPTALHHPCSGKHLGFLTTALHRKEPLEGYVGREHPVQQRVEHTLSELTDADLQHAPHGIDGCGIPAFAIPLYNIALAMARFADPSHLHYPRQQAIHRILEAVVAYPEMLSGEDGFDAKIIKLTHGHVICKTGAGGVIIGIIPPLGFGICLKIEDGNPKAAELAFLAILRSLGLLDADLYEIFQPRVPILSQRGKTVGFLQPTNFTTIPLKTGWH